MSREHRKKWMNRVLSLLLIAVMLLEPSTVSRAAEVPGLTGEGETVLETGQTTDPEEVSEPSDSEEDSETSNPEEDADAGEPEQGEEPEEDPEPAQPGASEDGVSGNDIGDETEENGTEESAEDLQAQEADRTANAAEDFEISGTTLVRYNGTDSKVVIPDGIVTIDNDAFSGNINIEYVKFPSSLRTVKSRAFEGCSRLERVEMNEGLSEIKDGAFNDAGLRDPLTIPSSVIEIGVSAFESCTRLEEVTFANGSEKELAIGEYAFRFCWDLEKVTLSDSVKVIPKEAFREDESLEEVVFGKAITSISQDAFLKCSALKEITCPASLTTIGDRAFSGCTELRTAQLPEGLLSIGMEAFSGAGFGGKTQTQATEYGTLTIPSTVTTIGERAFEKSPYLGEVTFASGSAGEVKLEKSVFQECSGLKKVTLSDSIQVIPESAFSSDASLEEVIFGNAVKTISQDAFLNCSALKEIACPASLTTIGKRAFSGCTELRKVQLPEGLSSIGEEAFAGVGFGGKTQTQATEYGTLTIPSTVTSIGAHAFWKSPYLGEVTFANGAVEEMILELEIFRECPSLKKVTLSDAIKVIPRNAFWECSALEEVEFANNLTEIGEYAFSYCKALRKIEIPGSVKVINTEAFASCTALRELYLNEGLQVIGDRAFASTPLGGKDDNQKLTSGKVTIPSTVYKMGGTVFNGCTDLEEVFFANGTTETLEFSGNEIFYNCENLKRVYLPDRFKTIPQYVITRCPKLEKLYIPASVQSIDDGFLKDCDKKNLTIYGDPDTEAERFAKSHNIPFKQKQELDIYVNSIRLDRKTISVAGEDSIGDEFFLQATILPGTALNKGVVYSSENEQVAKVDEEGTVTITGYGQTRICAASAENDSIKAYCEVSVLKEFTEEEIDAVREYLSENNGHDLLTNVYGSVSDIRLNAPDGVTVEWKEPEEEVQTGENSYMLRLQKDGYKTTDFEGFTIRGITVTGVQMEKAISVEKGKQKPVSVKLLTEGAQDVALDYQLEWSTANANVSVTAQENPLEVVVTGNKVSKNTAVTVKIVLKRDGKAVSVDKNNLGKTWFTATTKVTVCNYGLVDYIKVTAKQGKSEIELEALESLYQVPFNQTYILEAQAYAEEQPIKDAALTWKSNNTKVASVKTDKKTGTTSLKISGTGAALITVTASKNGGYTYSFRVVVKDSKPRLVQKTVTMNALRSEPSAEVTILPSDGFAIDESSLSVVNAKNGRSSIFKIRKEDGDTYKITTEGTDAPKKGSYAVKILVKTDAGEQESYALPITVKVIEQKPKVTLQQQPINLYEKDGRGVVYVNTDADVESITYTPTAGIGTVRLVQDTSDVTGNSITVKAENAQADNFAKAANKGTLRVTFEGYRSNVSYESKITLAVNKAPKIVASAESSILYPETAADTTSIVIRGINRDSGHVTVKTPDNYNVTVKSINWITLQALRGAKAGNVVLTATDDNWFDTVSPQVTCKMKTGKAPTLSFESSTVVLNTAYTVPEFDPVGVYAYIKNFERTNFVDKSAQFTGKNAQARQALDSGAIVLYMKDGEIKAGLADPDFFKKAGSYSYEVTASTAEGKSAKGVLKINVVLQKNAPVLTFSTKGEINLLNRRGTHLELRPKLKNYTGKIVSAELYGANAGKFKLGIVDGVEMLHIYAADDAKLKANVAYTLGIKVILDSGVELKTQVKTTPRQKISKLASNVKTVTLYETAKGEVYGQKLTVTAITAKDTWADIENIRLADDSDTFGYTYGVGGEGILYVKEKASMVAGKTYTLKLEVTFEDSAVDAKPSYVTVKVVYNK